MEEENVERPEQKRTETSKNLMIDALEKSLGIVTVASKICGVARTSHYEWLHNDPEYKKRVEDISELTIDFVESQLHQQIKGGEVASTIFYMKTKGKKRGYIERAEIDHSGNMDIKNITVEIIETKGGESTEQIPQS